MTLMGWLGHKTSTQSINLHNLFRTFCFLFLHSTIVRQSVSRQYKLRSRGYKTFFMLNSTEHEISLGHKNKNTVDSRYLEFQGTHWNTSRYPYPVLAWNYGNFSSTLFYIYVSNFRSQITYSFVKCSCSIYCFPHSLNSDKSRYGYLEVFQWVPWNSR